MNKISEIEIIQILFGTKIIFKLPLLASMGRFCWSVGWSVVGKKRGKIRKLTASMRKTKTTGPWLIVHLRLLTIEIDSIKLLCRKSFDPFF